MYTLLLTWLPRLAPGGNAWLVVQKNLGSDSLQRWLATELDTAAQRIASMTLWGFVSVPSVMLIPAAR